MHDIETIVIGAGAVGLACAAELARSGHDVIVLERNAQIGMETSSRNSEVIHAGIYYKRDSLKHRLCIEGRRSLYTFLEDRKIPYRKCGKLIVATDSAEAANLHKLMENAQGNGVEGLELITAKAANAMEADLRCVGAIHSPETGIVDSHGFMLALQGILEDFGGMVAFNAPVQSIEPLAGGGFALVTGGREPVRLTARQVVNSAGLWAHRLAQQLDGGHVENLPPYSLAKGSYFALSGRSPFSRLVYPAPVEGGLGVHSTIDLSGRTRFGPDVEWLESANPDEVDYKVYPERADGFYEVIRTYWPGLPDNSLLPDYSGCRPKVHLRGQPAGDFMICGPETHGHDGLVNLLGIESPGLTSALAIAARVRASLLEEMIAA